MSNDNDEGRDNFRKLLSVWHKNNGITGLCEYFDWGGYSMIYKHLAKETGESVRNLILADFSSSSLPVGQTNRFQDDYVQEWWNVWKTGSLSKVYFRSDGSIYDWLLSIVEQEQWEK